MYFIIATQDYAGLGFALRLLEEGHQVLLATNPEPKDLIDSDLCARYQRVGEGMIEKVPLRSLLLRRSQFMHAYWIWDLNHSVEENETLRTEGFHVLGGGQHADTMEHDRAACIRFVARYGLTAPPSFRFDDVAQAIHFCQEHPNTAYVYKPDTGDKYETFLPECEAPEDANYELQIHFEDSGEAER